MNERIKELAVEAGYKDLPTVRLAFQGFDKQKFAELIVKECCVALNPMLRDMISRGQGADLIKQHFGVEE